MFILGAVVERKRVIPGPDIYFWNLVASSVGESLCNQQEDAVGLREDVTQAELQK